jgi:Cu/Ag efflux pump CusA
MSVAVAVGFIALAGVAAETGVIMLIYLDHAMKELQAERAAEGKEFTRADQCGKRVRPFASSGMNESAPPDVMEPASRVP